MSEGLGALFGSEINLTDFSVEDLWFYTKSI